MAMRPYVKRREPGRGWKGPRQTGTMNRTKKGDRSLPCFDRTSAEFRCYQIVTLAKMIANVYNAMDSIKTSAKIRAN